MSDAQEAFVDRRQFVVVLGPKQVVEMPARAECAARAGDDKGANRVVGLRGFDGLDHRIVHWPGHGVAHVGIVQGQHDNAVVLLNKQGHAR